VRFDWAQDLLGWFDYYLKGTGTKPVLRAEVQDNAGAWRVEETYPPKDALWLDNPLSAATKGHDGEDLLYGAEDFASGVGSILTYTFPALSADKDLRIAGMTQLQLAVTPTGPGGQAYAILRDAETGMHLGHAIMDARYASGGTEMMPVVPGQPLTMMMEFWAMDVILPAGHGLKLQLSATGEDYLPSAVNGPLVLDLAHSVLKVPTIERGPEAFFTPPPIDPAFLATVQGQEQQP
jgi:predicted acyl esterase